MHLDVAYLQVYYPGLRDSGPGVERQFDVPVVGEGSVGDLDNCQDILGAWWTGSRGVRPFPQEGEVRLGLVTLGEPYRILYAHEISALRPLDQQMRQGHHARQVPAPDRCHVYYLPVNQLDPVVLAQDAGLSHDAVLPGGEPVPLDLEVPSHHLSLTPLYRVSRHANTRICQYPGIHKISRMGTLSA